MAYEYEKENKEAVMINQPKANKELEEVYQKAKAFDEVFKILDVYLGDVEDEINALNLIREKIRDMEDE